jgi:deoxyribodipyrimidine photo-lyase
LNEKLLSQWINGATSSDFINANMIELKQTGFMSNRGRQNVASFVTNLIWTGD